MGKITKIEVQKRNKKRVNVYIDEEYAFSVGMEIVYKENLTKGLEVDEEKLSIIVKKENVSKCKETALRILDKSYKSEKELKEKLVQKEYDKYAIDQTLNFLHEYNLVNDEKYAKLYIKDRLRTQGRNKIKYSLIQKGINEEIISELLEESDKEEEKNIAYNLANKKYIQLQKREDDIYIIKNKLSRFLIGRGYDYSMIKDIINEIVNNQ